MEKKETTAGAEGKRACSRVWLFIVFSMVLTVAGAIFIRDPKVHLSDRPGMEWYRWGGIILTSVLYLFGAGVHRKYGFSIRRFSLLMLIFLDAAIGLCLFNILLMRLRIEHESFFYFCFLIILPAAVVAAFILALMSLFRNSSVSSRLFAIGILCLIVTQTALPRTILYFEQKAQARHMLCGHQLKILYIAFSFHKKEMGGYPNTDNWCDDLGDNYDVDLKYFQCPVDKVGPCSYAMNENIPPDAETLPNDVVIFFESAPGWNQAGGADDVVMDRHDKTGANFVFANGDVRFVRKEDIGNLHWVIEE